MMIFNHNVNKIAYFFHTKSLLMVYLSIDFVKWIKENSTIC